MDKIFKYQYIILMSVVEQRVRTHGAYNEPSNYPYSVSNLSDGLEVEYNSGIYRIVSYNSETGTYNLAKYDDSYNGEDNKIVGSDVSGVMFNEILPHNYVKRESCRAHCYGVDGRQMKGQPYKKMGASQHIMMKKVLVQTSKEQCSTNSKTWHQASDKAEPSVTRRGGVPIGIGVDIKHNSYARRLNKLKARNTCL